MDSLQCTLLQYSYTTNPQVSEWRVTHVDTVFVGYCYHLDLSKKLGPGEQWMLSLAFDEHLRHNDSLGGRHSGYYLMVREEEEDFVAGPNFAQDFMPKGKLMDVGKSYLITVVGKVGTGSLAVLLGTEVKNRPDFFCSNLARQ